MFEKAWNQYAVLTLTPDEQKRKTLVNYHSKLNGNDVTAGTFSELIGDPETICYHLGVSGIHASLCDRDPRIPEIDLSLDQPTFARHFKQFEEWVERQSTRKHCEFPRSQIDLNTLALQDGKIYDPSFGGTIAIGLD